MLAKTQNQGQNISTFGMDEMDYWNLYYTHRLLILLLQSNTDQYHIIEKIFR